MGMTFWLPQTEAALVQVRGDRSYRSNIVKHISPSAVPLISTGTSCSGLRRGRYEDHRARYMLTDVFSSATKGNIEEVPLTMAANDERISLELVGCLHNDAARVAYSEEGRHL